MNNVLVSNSASPDQEPLTASSKASLLHQPMALPPPSRRPHKASQQRWCLLGVSVGVAALLAVGVTVLLLEVLKCKAETQALRQEVDAIQEKLQLIRGRVFHSDSTPSDELYDYSEFTYDSKDDGEDDKKTADDDDEDDDDFKYYPAKNDEEGDDEGDYVDDEDDDDYEDDDDGADSLRYFIPAPPAAPKANPAHLPGNMAGVFQDLESKLKSVSPSSSTATLGKRSRREIAHGVPVIAESYGVLPKKNHSALELYDSLVAGDGPTQEPTESPIKKHHRVSSVWSAKQEHKKHRHHEVEGFGHHAGTPQPPPLITRSSRVMETDSDRNSRVQYHVGPRAAALAGASRSLQTDRYQEMRAKPEVTVPKPLTHVKPNKLRTLHKIRSVDNTGNRFRLPAAHFEGDTSHYSVDGDRYLGNGIHYPQNKRFVDWKASEWVKRLKMDNFFTLNNGYVTIKKSGLYFLYAQIYYLDPGSINGYHVYVDREPVLQCTVSIHETRQTANSCFTASVVFLNANTTISIRDIREKRYSDFQKHKSFFGLVKLGSASF